jgi:predicted nucleotidyltransferase
LTKVAGVGLLKREKRGNQQVYSADTGSPVYSELASILRKTSGMADVLVQALMPVAPSLRAAFIFGSVARGSETAASDVDLMLIGDITFKQAVELLYPVQAALGREVNAQVLSMAEFRKKARKQPFLVEVLAKPKIFLIGSEDDLEELAGHHA